jgi:WD40-like Beta Propeller Repeat
MMGLVASAAVVGAVTGALANEAGPHVSKVLLPMFGGELSAWSPDSRQIAVPESKVISIRGIDGKVQRRLRGAAIDFPFSPDWTDDGARIQFLSLENEVDGDAVVGSVAVDGGDEQYRSLGVSVNAAAWAPAGWPLIYIPISRITGMKGKQVKPYPDLWRLDSLYGEPRKLIGSRVNEYDPLFSPDGTEIAFMREREWSSSLWKVSADGANPQRLAGNLLGPSSVAWSPDGRQIALSTCSRRRGCHLYVLPADGGQRRRIVDEEILANRPAWTPDGRWITFPTFDGEIRKVHPDGTGLQTVARLPGKEIGGLSWSPDGEHLAYTAQAFHWSD